MAKSAKDAVLKYYSNLLEVLPVNLLMSTLYSRKLLSEDHKRTIDSSSTRREKSQYFLDNVIIPSLKINYTEQFDETLKIMETCDDPAVKHLVEKITLFLGYQPSPSVSPKAKEDDTNNSPALIQYSTSDMNTAYHKLVSEITDIIQNKNFKKMRRALYAEIHSVDSTLPESLANKLQVTKSLDDTLDVLALSPYWNWFDTRLLQALVSASGSAEAEALLEQFKQIHYSRRVSEILPYVTVVPLKASIDFTEKFNKEPHELTLLDILKHKHILEYEVLDIGEKKIVLRRIKTGCIELTWQVPLELVYQAYTSMKRKHGELSSLAVKSLVCEETDEVVGVPILWCGQEIGEVGPIEPLPEHVRQVPYSLPQGFQWDTLSSSDAEEIVAFKNKHVPVGEADPTMAHQAITHPHTKSDWQFAIRTTNGKLVGVVMAHQVHVIIRGESVFCVTPSAICHKKYNNNRLWYMLLKELQRRVNLSKINQFYFSSPSNTLFKPVTTLAGWYFQFTQPASYQLPSSPRTPGWRIMTSQDIPSTLALVNKYSSQFEIGRKFSKEEISHYFLCPTVPNRVFTYVIEHGHEITDLVCCILLTMKNGSTMASVTIVISTHSPVKQLITDVMVCGRDKGAIGVQLYQHNIKSNILSSLGFQQDSTWVLCFYNYKYPEISEANYFYML